MSKIINFKSRRDFDEEKNQKMLDLWEQYLKWEKTNQANLLDEFQDKELVIVESNVVIFNNNTTE